MCGCKTAHFCNATYYKTRSKTTLKRYNFDEINRYRSVKSSNRHEKHYTQKKHFCNAGSVTKVGGFTATHLLLFHS